MHPDSDTASPPSKEPIPPRVEAPKALPPEKEKKPDKKLETPVLVAIISASVTLITAIMGSPMFLNLVNKTATATPTPAAAIVVSQSSMLPINPPDGDSIQAQFTPTASGADSLMPTSTAPGEDSTATAPSLEPTFIPATPPPNAPGDPTPAPPSTLQCLATGVWLPYPSTLNPGSSDGCWNLADWGFTSGQGGMILAPKPAQDQQRGIYMPISGDVDVRFSIQLNEFRTRLNKGGFLNFGIVQSDPFSIYKGGYLSYQQPTPGTESPVHVLISGSNQATQNISVLDAGFQHEVLLSIKGNRMTVYLNGEQSGDAVNLPRTHRAFWIGYVLPSKSVLEATITDFTIQTH